MLFSLTNQPTSGTRHWKCYLGNYWDDYEGTDADGDGDGIGDTHYSTYSKSDDYPLMKPIENYILP
jgi:nitrous oxidase accessory protein NosD